jgi:hypothetical protein
MKTVVREKIENTLKSFLQEHTDARTLPPGAIDDLCEEVSKRIELALVPFLRTNKFDFGDGAAPIEYDEPLENPIRRRSDLGDD